MSLCLTIDHWCAFCEHSGENIKWIWSCDGASSLIPLQGVANHVGVLELPGGLWEGGSTYTITMKAIWASGASAETWITFTAAQGPHGGTCTLSAPNGTAMVDRFSIDCPLWTTADPVSSLLHVVLTVVLLMSGKVVLTSLANSDALCLSAGITARDV